MNKPASMKIEFEKEEKKAVYPPSGAALFLAALRANGLLLAGIAAVYALLIAGAYGFKRPLRAAGAMDIVFVFDTTGSMQDKMSATVDKAQGFVDRLARSRLSSRLALVAFGAQDEPRPVVRRTVPFSPNVDDFRRALGDLQAEGGGREDPLTALVEATTFPAKEGASVVYLLITDEVYNIPSTCGKTFDQVLGDLKSRGVHVYAVTCSEGADFDQTNITREIHVSRVKDFRRLAAETGGRWYDIESRAGFSDILQQVAEDIATSLVR